MSDVDDQIRELKSKISVAQSRKVRATMELEDSRTKLAEARNVLKSEFGVTTTEEAREVITKLQKNLQDSIERIESALNDAGA